MTATVIADRFVLEAPVASGGMGTIYRGRDAGGALVAVKVLRGTDPVERERFAREVAVLAGLSHPGIVGYLAHGELADGRPYLVMNWVDGETLDARLAGAGLTMAESLTVVRRAADALGHAHARGLVHRDVKPSNLIFPGGDVDRTIVLDFGIARSIARTGSLTETGAVVGTPSYMAPEQARGEPNLDPGVDVFALGCVLYECLTGRLAFEGKRFLALTAKILLWDPPPARALNADVPAELDQLVTEMLAKEPGARPANGAEVAARLAAIPIERLSGGSRRARLPSPPTTIVRRAPSPLPASGRLSGLVIAAAPELPDAAGPTLTASAHQDLLGLLDERTRAFGARLVLLADGSVLAVLDAGATPLEIAVRAAGCARALRAQLPGALIGICAVDLGSGVAAAEQASTLFERTVGDLARDAIAAVFAGVTDTAAPPPAGIRVDEQMAALLERDHPIVRAGGGIYLRGEQ